MRICSAIMDMGPGPGPGPKKGAVPAAAGAPFSSPGPQPKPKPISIMAEHMRITGGCSTTVCYRMHRRMPDLTYHRFKALGIVVEVGLWTVHGV